MAEKMAGDGEQPDSGGAAATALGEDQAAVMHHLQEMMAAIFRIARRNGSMAAITELRQVIVGLIQGEKTMRHKAGDIDGRYQNGE